MKSAFLSSTAIDQGLAYLGFLQKNAALRTAYQMGCYILLLAGFDCSEQQEALFLKNSGIEAAMESDGSVSITVSIDLSRVDTEYEEDILFRNFYNFAGIFADYTNDEVQIICDESSSRDDCDGFMEINAESLHALFDILHVYTAHLLEEEGMNTKLINKLGEALGQVKEYMLLDHGQPRRLLH